MFPRRTTDHGTKEDESGQTHSRGTPCPFEADNFPIGMLGTCCSLRGKIAAYELDALGEDNLCERMYQDMTAAEALAFASELGAAATRLEVQHRDPGVAPRGAGFNGIWDEATKAWVWQGYSTFDDAIATIREGARWYEKVARLGFGVHAWY